MKKILYRKLLYDYLTFLFLSLLSTAVVIWVFQSVNYLDIMIEDGRDYLVYLNFSLLNFPKILSKIFPFVLFFTIFYVTTKYELSNELMIFWNFGVHKIEIINFIFKISILLMLFQILLSAIIVPKSQDLARSFLRNSNVNFLGSFVKPQKFNDTIKGVTIYANKKDKNGDLENLYIKREIDNNEFQITYAKKGEFKEIKNSQILVLYKGSTITSKNDKITNISFSKSDFSLIDLKSNTTTYIKTQEISSFKLIKCINNFYKFNKIIFEKLTNKIENCTIENMSNIFKELYKRFIIPFYIPILSLLPFLIIIISKENASYQKLRYSTFLIGLGIIIFSETTIRFISNSTFQNINLILIPLLVFIILYLFLFYKFKANFIRT
ncbi:LptF/LptG family permease [Candidatus Pelagibacter sp.]|uniref:LptF/LptG family permease n=1 Tax=Candidatus Pelagibacter sp. TaxID=2024849 RepID=UPI003F87F598